MAVTLSRAIAVACAAEISPTASAEQVLGRWLVRARAMSIFICADVGESRSAVETSSRSASSIP